MPLGGNVLHGCFNRFKPCNDRAPRFGMGLDQQVCQALIRLVNVYPGLNAAISLRLNYPSKAAGRGFRTIKE